MENRHRWQNYIVDQGIRLKGEATWDFINAMMRVAWSGDYYEHVAATAKRAGCDRATGYRVLEKLLQHNLIEKVVGTNGRSTSTYRFMIEGKPVVTPKVGPGNSKTTGNGSAFAAPAVAQSRLQKSHNHDTPAARPYKYETSQSSSSSAQKAKKWVEADAAAAEEAAEAERKTFGKGVVDALDKWKIVNESRAALLAQFADYPDALMQLVTRVSAKQNIRQSRSGFLLHLAEKDGPGLIEIIQTRQRAAQERERASQKQAREAAKERREKEELNAKIDAYIAELDKREIERTKKLAIEWLKRAGADRRVASLEAQRDPRTHMAFRQFVAEKLSDS